MIIKSKMAFKISVFGWELVLLRYPAIEKGPYKDHGIRPTGVYIKREGNFLLACDVDGKYLQPQISLTINDGVEGPSTITVKYFFAGIYEEKRD